MLWESTGKCRYSNVRNHVTVGIFSAPAEVAKPQHRTHQIDAEVSGFLDHTSPPDWHRPCLNDVSVVCG
jgi:hypothetical protein